MREAVLTRPKVEQVRSKRRRWKLRPLKEHHFALILLAPSLIAILVLIGWPIIYSIFLSIHKVEVAGGMMRYELVGLRNYITLFKDVRFRQAFSQTVLYATVQVSAVMGIGTILALILNQSLFGVGLFKRLFLLPWALSYVVNALMWGWVFHGNFGVLNAILLKLGLIEQYHVWLADPKEAMPVIIFASIWKATPFAALMLLAALKTVPEELMDAAKVDGAGAWARFVYVTLPWIKSVFAVLLVIQTMWALKTFDLIWILTEGGPMDKTMVLNAFAYQQAFQFFKFGYGSAASYIITGLILGLTLLYLRLLKSEED